MSLVLGPVPVVGPGLGSVADGRCVLFGPVGAGNSAAVVDLPRCGPMLSPRVPHHVPIPGPRIERETPGQRPRPNYGHPQGSISHTHKNELGSMVADTYLRGW